MVGHFQLMTLWEIMLDYRQEDERTKKVCSVKFTMINQHCRFQYIDFSNDGKSRTAPLTKLSNSRSKNRGNH